MAHERENEQEKLRRHQQAEQRAAEKCQREENLKRLAAWQQSLHAKEARWQNAEARRTVEPSEQVREQIFKANMQSFMGAYSRSRGLSHEPLACAVLEETRDMSRVEFTHAAHGYDGVMRDRAGTIVIVEAKTSPRDASFQSHLHDTKHGRQCSDEWIRAKALEMQKDSDPRNREIAQAILSAPERVKVLAVHMNPDTHEATVYERLDTQAQSWEKIAWSVSKERPDSWQFIERRPQ